MPNFMILARSAVCIGFVLPTVAMANCDSLQDLHWLQGSWQTEQGNVKIIEHWQQLDATTYTGSGVTRKLVDGSIISSESLRLLQMQDGVFYLAKVAHNPLPIAFKLTQCANGYARFENHDHDFPNQIEYHHSNGALQVNISDGKDKGFKLSFSALPGQ
jgi:hypothetical protein